MAKGRVAVLEVHETPGISVARTHCGRAIADSLIRRGHHKIGKRLIQMAYGKASEEIREAKFVRDLVALRLKQAETPIRVSLFYDGPIGVGNLLPFSKPDSTGDKLHYEIPRAGDRGLERRHHRRRIRVSHRNLFAKQAIA